MTAARDLAARLRPAVSAIKPPVPATPMVKYTLLMTADDAEAFDHLLLRVRRTEGRRVPKSQLIRSLLHLAVADASLLRQVLDEASQPVARTSPPDGGSTGHGNDT